LRSRSFAKINLHLEVRGRRPDGYHELLTVFQTIDLHDTLTFDDAPAGEISLTVTGAPGLSPGADNLAHRAAAAYFARYPARRGVAISLEKRIPMGAGMGGGSSNAATVLRALRQREQAPERVEDLLPLARALGADVPFFLVGGTAVGTGRGDEVRPLPDLDEEVVLVARPSVHLSTAAVFAAATPTGRPTPPGVAALLRGTPPRTLADLDGFNDLEAAALALAPALRDAPIELARAHAVRTWLTGSGAAFVGALRGEPVARPSVLRVRTLSRAGLAARLFE
jgi:4-diphosphocytidyl-2-C-methyl-D-erythritol kinase